METPSKEGGSVGRAGCAAVRACCERVVSSGIALVGRFGTNARGAFVAPQAIGVATGLNR